MNELLPSFQDEETDLLEGHNSSISGNDALSNGNLRGDVTKSAGPLFPEVDKLLALFKDSYKELVDLRKQVCFGICGYGTLILLIYCSVKVFIFPFSSWLKIDGRLFNLKKEVSVQDSKHRKTLAEVS